MSVGLVAHQFGQLVSAFQQLFQTLQQLSVGVEVNPVSYLSHLIEKTRVVDSSMYLDDSCLAVDFPS